MTTHRLRRVASWYCFSTLFVITVPSFAVNLEFGAGSPEEALTEVTWADVESVNKVVYPGSADAASISTTGYATSVSFAMTESFFDPAAFTESTVSVYTNISNDSSEAVVALAVPGLELPEEYGHIAGNQGAFAFSTQIGDNVESSLHSFSTIASALSNVFEITLDENTSTIVDVMVNPIVEDWIIDVLPSPGETAGAPTLVRIDTVVARILAASGNGEASASWFVTVNEDIELIAGAANDTQLLAFGEAATYDFVIPLGSSFKLRFLWELYVSATDVATAAAEFTAASINISATIIPEPSSWLILAMGLMSFQHRWLPGCRSRR